MWRSRSLAEWERKKSYLIRSLFEDIAFLSPILEGYEPSSPSSPNFLYRAESPLPELIIEVEPKKPNPHDDPEELYDELAKEMRRLYRKDFLDIDISTSDPENSSSESLNRGIIYDIISDGSNSDNTLDENMLKDKYRTDFDASNHQIDSDLDSSSQTEIGISKESSESRPTASEFSLEYDIQEDPAFEQAGITESKQYRQSEEDSIHASKSTVVIESIGCGDKDADKEEESDTESFARDTDASSKDSSTESSVNSSQASPEIMRQRQPFASLGTPPRRTVSKSNSSINKTIHLSMEVESKEYSENVIESNQEEEIAEHSDNGTLLFVTSTPTRKRTCTRFSTETGHKRRLVSYSSSSSFASVANAALQTSFSDCETDWCVFWSNFFVGIPTLYNVCSCRDHVCTT